MESILFYLIGLCIVICIIVLVVVQIKTSKKENKKEVDLKPEILEYEEDKPSELDALLDQMNKDLEDPKEKTIEDFEASQEENAIISYKELLETCNKENIEENDEEKAITSIKKLEKTKENNTKFKNTEFISPIYGKIESNLDYPKIHQFKEETNNLSIDELEEEMKKNEEFLKELKEFRNSL